MKKIIITAMLIILVTNIVYAQNITQEALNAIIDAENIIKGMEENNFTTVYVNDLLIESKNALEEANYIAVIEKTNQIAYGKSQAYNISDALFAIEIHINELNESGADIETIENNFLIAKQYFKDENYNRAEERIEKIYIQLGETETEYRLFTARAKVLRNNIINYIQDNWEKILIGIFIGLVALYFIYRKSYLFYIDSKVQNLRKEEKVLSDLLIKTQEDRYVNKNLSESGYKTKIRKYKEELNRVKEYIKIYEKILKKRSLIRKPNEMG